MDRVRNSTSHLTLLSGLLLAEEEGTNSEQATPAVTSYGRSSLGQLWELATAHHVIIRTFPGLQKSMAQQGNGCDRWVENAMATERTRIRRALSYLSPICRTLEEAGEVVVIKSLDHWPDFGSDLDLFTTAHGREVAAIMRSRFSAQLAPRSWGDRLANKWNFIIPGLPELVEVHAGRLGQTGEQVAITDSLVARSAEAQFESYMFRVPAPEDRLLISTLQRMYRHFYLRMCDVADIARLIDSGTVDYVLLQSLAESAGLWDGLCCYLGIVGEYVKSYRRQGLRLPDSITSAARLGVRNVSFREKFLRIPIFPQSMRFYAKEWAMLLLNGELENALRLSLLPGLAVAAAVAFKTTGNDKGIW